jgi:DNA-binding CsgD family transcriptional regulator
MAATDGRFAEARDAIERMQTAVEGVVDPTVEAFAEIVLAVMDVWEGQAECALERLQPQFERSLKLGAGVVVPGLLAAMAWAELAAGGLDHARGRMEGLVSVVEGRDAYSASWARWLLAEVRRLLADGAAEATALDAQACGERIGNRLFATRARLTLGRLAAARGDWPGAQQHVLAHLDACAEGGHAPYVPACLDALGEVAAGLNAHEDAVRLFAAAERARADIGVVRIPPEARHWAAIDGGLREALGDEAYEAARAQGAELCTADALEWARRARGPRRRPPSGWGSLTPTERKVAELVAEGLTNPQIAKRMFISKATVKTHLAHIFKKLDVHSRTELTAHTARRNLTS